MVSAEAQSLGGFGARAMHLGVADGIAGKPCCSGGVVVFEAGSERDMISV